MILRTEALLSYKSLTGVLADTPPPTTTQIPTYPPTHTLSLITHTHTRATNCPKTKDPPSLRFTFDFRDGQAGPPPPLSLILWTLAHRCSSLSSLSSSSSSSPDLSLSSPPLYLPPLASWACLVRPAQRLQTRSDLVKQVQFAQRSSFSPPRAWTPAPDRPFTHVSGSTLLPVPLPLSPSWHKRNFRSP